MLEPQWEGFGYSLESDDTLERRSEPRHVAIRRVAKLLRGRAQELCLVRNISPGGLMADVYSEIAPAEAVRIELKSQQVLAGQVAWVRGFSAGVQFDEPIDVREVLAKDIKAAGPTPRPPRFEVDCRAILRVGADYCAADVRDLSQGGVKLKLAQPLQPGQSVVVTVAGMPPRAGVVRWCNDGFVGVAFNEVIPFDLITRWLLTRS